MAFFAGRPSSCASKPSSSSWPSSPTFFRVARFFFRGLLLRATLLLLACGRLVALLCSGPLRQSQPRTRRPSSRLHRAFGVPEEPLGLRGGRGPRAGDPALDVRAACARATASASSGTSSVTVEPAATKALWGATSTGATRFALQPTKAPSRRRLRLFDVSSRSSRRSSHSRSSRPPDVGVADVGRGGRPCTPSPRVEFLSSTKLPIARRRPRWQSGPQMCRRARSSTSSPTRLDPRSRSPASGGRPRRARDSPPGSRTPGSIDRCPADLHVHVDVDRVRVDEGHALGPCGRSTIRRTHGGGASASSRRVFTPRLSSASRGSSASTPRPCSTAYADDVGQIDLALLVVVGERGRAPPTAGPHREEVDAGVALFEPRALPASRPGPRRCARRDPGVVARRDRECSRAPRVRHQAGAALALVLAAHAPPASRATQQRRVAVEDEDLAREVAQLRLRLQHRVAGPVLLGLEHELGRDPRSAPRPRRRRARPPRSDARRATLGRFQQGMPSIGRPQISCSTLARRDFIRVPWPAARTITEAVCAQLFAALRHPDRPPHRPPV